MGEAVLGTFVRVLLPSETMRVTAHPQPLPVAQLPLKSPIQCPPLHLKSAAIELQSDNIPCVQDIINFVGTAVQAVLNGILFYQCIRTAQRQQPPPSSTQTQAAFES